jgi:CMP/dCMP kinase
VVGGVSCLAVTLYYIFMIIAIDGPAGAGKSTVAKEVAKRLNFGYLDTGAMYRAVTHKALKTQTDLNDPAALGRLVADSSLEMADSTVRIDGEDVTEAIRMSDVGRAVSIVSRAPQVRSELVAKQRGLGAAAGDMVVEGRDIGTVVFPDADIKIFLTARAGERSKRRLEELRRKGIDIQRRAVEQEMEARDELDSSRAVSPLEKAPDAHLIDTTDKSIEQVVDIILSLASS